MACRTIISSDTEAFGKLHEAGATLVEVATPDVVRAATDIGGTILVSELARGIARYLQEQGTGLTF
ncbi:hypothetical protein [Bradyrhizobium sp. ORS 111]|uniref:hypothetical protein n=1 Tax=Bradyrhizobium sp. ORS 111 TaxID=1685958 RepID=UPI00388F0C37